MNGRAGQRRDLRASRRALAPEFRRDAALAIARHLASSTLVRRGRRLAGFFAADAEADPGPALATARLLGCQVHLPVLDPLHAGGMRFVLTAAGQPLHPNRFGIPEPAAGAEIAPPFLDLVLVPLVAFDALGNRLGMGAGFYDRVFAFRKRRHRWHRPPLFGVAYSLQRVERIDPEPWDVPLDGVVTETGIEFF